MSLSFRRSVKEIFTFPISPPFVAVVISLLRGLGVLRRPSPGPGPSLSRILVCHPYSSVGDMVLLLPLLERIRAQWPDSCLDVVVGSNASDLLSGVEGLNRIFVCGSQNAKIQLIGYYRRFFRNFRLYKREVMPFDYDLALAPRWGSIMTSEAIYLAYFSNARLRVGYAASVDHGNRALDRLLTQAVVGGAHEHEVVRNVRLLERAGLTRATSDAEQLVNQSIPSLRNVAGRIESSLTGSLAVFSSTARPYGVISPGATRPFNRWPAERLASVMRDLHSRYSLHFCVAGGPSDAAMCEALAALAPECATSIAGQTSLRQLTRLLASADLFLGMDSGTAHIAGGLGIPTVIVSPFPSSCTAEHPNSPLRFRPCGPNVLVVQPENALPPCFPTCSMKKPHCIQQISAEDVVRVASQLLDAARFRKNQAISAG